MSDKLHDHFPILWSKTTTLHDMALHTRVIATQSHRNLTTLPLYILFKLLKFHYIKLSW